VAPGVAYTDAANMGQLMAVYDSAIQNANVYSARATAAALAQSSPYFQPGQMSAIAVKVGTYDGQVAYGLNFAGRIQEVTAQVGISGGSGSNLAASASLSIGW
jgi:hypothetical protein